MRERLAETRDIIAQTDKVFKKGVKDAPVVVSPLRELQTLSFEETMPLVDERYRRIMETRRTWAKETGKELVFFKGTNGIFYSYK